MGTVPLHEAHVTPHSRELVPGNKWESLGHFSVANITIDLCILRCASLTSNIPRLISCTRSDAFEVRKPTCAAALLLQIRRTPIQREGHRVCHTSPNSSLGHLQRVVLLCLNDTWKKIAESHRRSSVHVPGHRSSRWYQPSVQRSTSIRDRTTPGPS